MESEGQVGVLDLHVIVFICLLDSGHPYNAAFNLASSIQAHVYAYFSR